MRLARVAVAGLLLAGCSASRPPVVMPATFLGQWLEIDGAGRDVDRLTLTARGGFLALGREIVVLNLDGLPRIAAHPVETALEGGVGAGRITLDDGTRLYLSLGHGWAETSADGGRASAGADYVDIDVYRVIGDREAPLGARRLWSETGLRPPALPPARSPAVGSDQAFAAAVADPDWEAPTSAARALISLAAAGADPAAVDRARRDALRTLRVGVLVELQAARTDRAHARERLATAQARQRAVAAWDDASARWRDARG